jgi:peptide methionine sulfoxide reductase msrA/msrB
MYKNILIFTVGVMVNLPIYSIEVIIDKDSHNKLSSVEEEVILHKKTELRGSGKYYLFFGKGTYTCKQCNTPLYKSDDKFKSGCGWPAFDNEIDNAVKKQKDKDRIRTEISCTNCGAHLGHVFEGEKLTEKNIRHCVNSTSLIFVPQKYETHIKKAFFAGGCFWNVEYLFEKKNGVVLAFSGYMGGSKENPSYIDVNYGDTEHVEAVEVIYDSDIISYEDLVKYFFNIHDPTQLDRQGPNIGKQYSSIAFYKNKDEKIIISKLIGVLNKKGYQVVTKVLPYKQFWQAEEYHQNHYLKNNIQPYSNSFKSKF